MWILGVGVMAFAYSGAAALDYFPCRYGGSRLAFRGPARDLSLPYLVALGGTETYGRFIARPWPELVENETGWRMVNLGQPNAGPDVWLADPAAMRVIAQASRMVIQVSGAINLSNRFYQVHPRRNDRFLRAHMPLMRLFPEVDFTRFNFTHHLMATLELMSAERFEVLVAELQATWVARMQRLIRHAGIPVTLLWMADWPPPVTSGLGGPALIDVGMLDALMPAVAARVEVAFSDRARQAGLQGMAFAEMERAAASGLPGPLCHHEVAEAVAAALDL